MFFVSSGYDFALTDNFVACLCIECICNFALSVSQRILCRIDELCCFTSVFLLGDESVQSAENAVDWSVNIEFVSPDVHVSVYLAYRAVVWRI